MDPVVSIVDSLSLVLQSPVWAETLPVASLLTDESLQPVVTAVQISFQNPLW